MLISWLFWVIAHPWAMWSSTVLLVAAAALVGWALPKFRIHAILFAGAILMFSTYNTIVRTEAQNQVRAETKKANTNAKNKAQAARKVQRDRCSRNPDGCVRDRWFRD